ncbi:hypothetical protein B0H14DRAFT_3767903 [Mycena olivaceomarginata]|nr:hypothetical protein B0H14DRAFT_3767903 [Mycena olivaceomarginata]
MVGTNLACASAPGKDKVKKAYEIKDYDVIITTYQALSFNFHVPKDTVDVGDEAQYLEKHGCVSFAPSLAWMSRSVKS